ncbi:MAG TPA: BrnA antitoxin family protein [Xylella taiwanensis]
MPKLKVEHISPTPDENAAINAGIAADSDARELGVEWFAKAKPASEVLPPEMYATLATKRPRGRPKVDETKVFTAIRLDADLLETFKATGKGWQTRVNAALRQFIAEHPLNQ